jgi:hypothetical protein
MKSDSINGLNDRIDYLDRHGRFEEADIARRMYDWLFPIEEYDRSEFVVNGSGLENKRSADRERTTQQ